MVMCTPAVAAASFIDPTATAWIVCTIVVCITVLIMTRKWWDWD